jgi:CHAT domain-containing protein
MPLSLKTFVPISLAIALGSLICPQFSATHVAQIGVSQAIAQTQTERDLLAEADQLIEEAESKRRTLPNQAIVSLQRALSIYQALGKDEQEAKTLTNMGFTYALMEDFSSAILLYKKALKAAYRIKNIPLESEILTLMGTSYKNAKRYQKGLDNFQKVMRLSQKISNLEVREQVLKSLFYRHSSIIQRNQFLKLEPDMMKFVQSTRSKELESFLLHELGKVYYITGQYDLADQYYHRALSQAKTSDLNHRYKVFVKIAQVNYLHLKNEEKAVKAYQQVELLSRQIELNLSPEIATKSLKCASDSVRDLSVAYGKVGNLTKAIEYGKQALVINHPLNDKDCHRRNLDLILDRTIDTLQKTENIDQTLQDISSYLQEYKKNTPKVSNHSQIEKIVQTLIDRGKREVSTGNYTTAMQIYQKTLSFITKEVGENAGESEQITVWFEIAELYIESQDYDSASKSLDNILQTVLHKEYASYNSMIVALIYTNLDEVYSLKGDSKKAEQFYQKAIAIIRKQTPSDLEKGSISNGKKSHSLSLLDSTFFFELTYILDNYVARYEFDKAIAVSQEALRLTQPEANLPFKDAFLRQWVLLSSSNLYDNLGDYAKTQKYLQEVASETEGTFWGDASKNDQLLWKAQISLRQKDYQKAIALAQEMLERVKNEISRFSGIDGIAADFNDIIEIDGVYVSSILAEVNFFYRSQALMLQSIGHKELKNYPKAFELGQQSLKTLENMPPGGMLQTTEKNAAIKSLLAHLGHLHALSGSTDQAITSYQAALALNPHDHLRNAEVHAGMARVYRQQKQPALTVAYYKQAVQDIENIRQRNPQLSQSLQATFLKSAVGFDNNFSITDVYRELADLLLSQGRILEAQQVLDLLKVQEIKTFTRSARVGEQSNSITLTPAEEQILAQHGSLIALGRELEACQKTNCAHKTQLLEKRRLLTEQFNQAIAAETVALQQRPANDTAFLDPRNQFGTTAQQIIKAQPGTVLVYPLVLENKLWLLMAAEGGILKKFEVPVTQQQLGETVLQFRQQLQSPNSEMGQVQATGQQLYSWLIKPLESELKANKIKHLVFAPDRVTRYIPMAALHNGKQYLIEGYSVANILSANLTRVDDVVPLSPQQTPVLALGLSQAVADLPPLPGVPEELDAIVRQATHDPKGVYPGQELLDKNFTFAALEGNLFGHKILHIATHGKFEPGRPDASYLVMGDGQKLPIPKIETLQDLGDVKLVTLSACETALGGAGQDGTEIAGLSYYFLAKGAQAVMASLWLVNDGSTSELMQKFYTNLSQPNGQRLTKAEALQQTQIALIRGRSESGSQQRGDIQVQPTPGGQASTDRSLAHPYYWAPFILIGNSL